ncbi:MAG: excinuclease ABC subunit UvrC [Chromatiales bacterium]|nr:excinuclease ABC subunit UvrC [Chromatiales bacterium]
MSNDHQPQGFDSAAFLKTLTGDPGVYRMLDQAGKVIYVGKARHLKRRVSSYFTRSALAPKVRAMVNQVAAMEVTVTRTEGEALLLESQLIKALKPRYNVLLRDDKSYPYIHLTDDSDFPRLSFYRGSRKEKGRFFGPYPSAGAVRETLQLLQKLFPVRQCEDSFYRNRSRPCLQHQIQRCTAPCVGLVTPEIYAGDVRHAVMFLEGRSTLVVEELVQRMEKASAELDFEAAARYRDQIASLRKVQQRQYVSGERGDVDIVAAAVKQGLGCVQVFFVRAGHSLGNKTYFPRLPEDTEAPDMLAAFLPQYYLSREVPGEILVNHRLAEQGLLEEVLSTHAGHKVTISDRLRGDRARWLEMANNNAGLALDAKLASRAGMGRRLAALQELLKLDDPPSRMECFDISHTMGERTVASCVVFNQEGPLKTDYRRFNIEGIEPGDDYAAMRQALTRRYTRLRKGEGKLPDILFIDGGKGQLGMARDVLEELQVGGVALVGVAKGVDRRAGLEDLFVGVSTVPLRPSADSPALHLIQQIRDEAHRFAITGHRKRREKARKTSVLEEIPGLGPKRRQALLKHLGGLREVSRAGVEDLQRVPGISRPLAEKIVEVMRSRS